MASLPTINITGSNSTLPLPSVFTAPIRLDIVHSVHKSIAKNNRQAYAPASNAGEQTSAKSWGTGRAVARIPRVSGSGTAAAGSAAFGNMCRGGRMFAPNKTWRKWHVKVNQNQRRFAVVSALAASALPSLVLARGHRIEGVSQVPCVVSDDCQAFKKTRQAVSLLTDISAIADVTKVSNSRKARAGKGKMRNRRHTQRKGPLVVYNEDEGIVRAFRNIPGVELCQVTRLNLLQLAPGGHLGRFVIWTKSAFEQLDSVFGTFATPSADSACRRQLPTAVLANTDLARMINSEEIQSVLKAKQSAHTRRPFTQKKNPLKNKAVLFRLNPYAKTLRRQEEVQQRNAIAAKAKGTKKADAKGVKKAQQDVPGAGKAFLTSLLSA